MSWGTVFWIFMFLTQSFFTHLCLPAAVLFERTKSTQKCAQGGAIKGDSLQYDRPSFGILPVCRIVFENKLSIYDIFALALLFVGQFSAIESLYMMLTLVFVCRSVFGYRISIYECWLWSLFVGQFSAIESLYMSVGFGLLGVVLFDFK